MIDQKELVFSGYESDFVIIPSNYFSGPNLNFRLKGSVPDFFNIEQGSITKTTMISNLTVSDQIFNVQTIDYTLVYSYQDQIFISDLSTNQNFTITEIKNPLEILEYIGSSVVIY